MRARRVAVTGIGAVTPIGSGAAGLWDGIQRGTCAIGRLSRFDPGPFRSQLAAEINDFDPLDHMDTRAARRLDRFAQLAVAAARMARADAGMATGTGGAGRRAGVSIGSALGGTAYAEQQHEAFLERGIRAVDTTLAIAVYGGAAAANVAIDLDLRGPCLSNANSCASGAMAIGDALRAIRAGEADVMLAGGAEAPLAPLTYGSFALIRAMSVRNDDPRAACRPFDVERDGFVMGEGAAILVLEEWDHAERRGARIYAELLGYGHSSDAYHMTAPRPDGSEAARAIALALADGDVSPAQIDYVSAHATGTVLGDRAEACAIHRALGRRGEEVPVGATKGLHGHALGATGAIEAALVALALHTGFLPGVANLREAEPGCALNLLPPEGSRAEPEVALSTSFGFGGANAALVFGRSAGA